MPDEQKPTGPNIQLKLEDLGGVWANYARVKHSPYEFTIDFVRLEFDQNPPTGVVVSRVNLSPLFVTQLIDALTGNWDKYAQRALPPEARSEHPEEGEEDA